jgi:hypothetical protein
MAAARPIVPVSGWSIWGRPLGLLLLLLLGPLALFRTPLHGLAAIWLVLLILGFWMFLMAMWIALMVGSVPAVLGLAGVRTGRRLAGLGLPGG